MHLINTQTPQLEAVTGENDVEYAILSHRWENDEVFYDDMNDLSSCHKVGLDKLKGFCKLAKELDYQYVWMGTCCIDKRSSAELSEAINSMYRYYESAKACIAYLSDVHNVREDADFEQSFRHSVWFTRCWTLQELLAPRDVTFYNADWHKLGTKAELVQFISDIAGINASDLRGTPLSDFSIAQRMAWASHRHATRPEDVAYSLMGIFDVNMPMLYREGNRAFTRLQEETLRFSDDETIFAWQPIYGGTVIGKSGLLAVSPFDFQNCQYLVPSRLHEKSDTFTLTSRGLTGTFYIAPQQDDRGSTVYLAFLNASFRIPNETEQFIGIVLRQVSLNEQNFVRILPFKKSAKFGHRWTSTHVQVSGLRPSACQVHVRHRGKNIEVRPQPAYGFDIGQLIHSTSSSLISMFGKNDGQFDERQVTPAPGARWGYSEDINRLVVRLPPRLAGPVCNIEIEGAVKDIAFIQLGLSEALEPICIIVDNIARRSHRETSTVLALESFDSDEELQNLA